MYCPSDRHLSPNLRGRINAIYYNVIVSVYYYLLATGDRPHVQVIFHTYGYYYVVRNLQETQSHKTDPCKGHIRSTAPFPGVLGSVRGDYK
jgi:hypothetical protein